MNSKPLLSICIPTYSRSEYLKRSVESIVGQDEYNSGEVEIVISDNCSTDDTKKVCSELVSKYPNIKYFRNEQNVRDRNFPLVISRASGVYRKLCNDTLLFKDGSLKLFLDLIKTNKDERPVFFFENNGNVSEKFNNVNDFLLSVSYLITWIGGFGVWENDCKGIENNTYGCDKSLWQVPFLLSCLRKSKNYETIGDVFCTTQPVAKKDISYGLYKVFHDNFLGFINESASGDFISQKTYLKFEKDLLFKFFPFWMYNFSKQNKKLLYSKNEDLLRLVFDGYKRKKYYPMFRFYYFFYRLKSTIYFFAKKIKNKFTKG